MELFSPQVTYVSSIFVVTTWLVAIIYVRKLGISWVSTGGRPVRIKRIGRAVHWGIFGMLLLLWVPRAISLVDRVVDGSGRRFTARPGLLDSLSKAGLTVLGSDTVNMDGSGESEILTLWRPREEEEPGALEVFTGRDSSWTSLLKWELWPGSCDSFIDYEWLNMRGNDFRQLAIWSNECKATGSLQVFSYRGFDYLERIVDLDLEEENVRVVDNQIIVLGNGQARVCMWRVDRVSCEQERVDAGDNTVFVEFAYSAESKGLRVFGTSGAVNKGGDIIRLHLGQYLSLAARKGTEPAYREIGQSDGILEYRAPFYYAKAIGETTLQLENASGSGLFYIIVIPDGDY